MARKLNPQYIYMLVTEDKYELPILTATSASELAKLCGVSKNTVITATWRRDNGITEKSKYVRVKLEEGAGE